MRIRMVAVTTLLAAMFAHYALAADKDKKVPTVLDRKMDSLTGNEVDLSKYLGKVVLVVNTASECGLTPQYAGLQELHEKYGEKGLAVLGFPCNQFGGQEPGTAKEISQFCTENYGVKFDMFAKIEVNGEGANDLYKHLTSHPTDFTTPQGVEKGHTGKINWNFEKFLIGRDGKVVARFHPRVAPVAPALVETIEEELEKKK